MGLKNKLASNHLKTAGFLVKKKIFWHGIKMNRNFSKNHNFQATNLSVYDALTNSIPEWWTEMFEGIQTKGLLQSASGTSFQNHES